MDGGSCCGLWSPPASSWIIPIFRLLSSKDFRLAIAFIAPEGFLSFYIPYAAPYPNEARRVRPTGRAPAGAPPQERVFGVARVETEQAARVGRRAAAHVRDASESARPHLAGPVAARQHGPLAFFVATRGPVAVRRLARP